MEKDRLAKDVLAYLEAELMDPMLAKTGDGGLILMCVRCLGDGVGAPAVTVIAGDAVCFEHSGAGTSRTFRQKVRSVYENLARGVEAGAEEGPLVSLAMGHLWDALHPEDRLDSSNSNRVTP